jgi:hypothetical protein
MFPANDMQVDELWDSMCHTSINLISKALNDVDNAEVLLKIKGVIALFIQTMDVSKKSYLPYDLAHRDH